MEAETAGYKWRPFALVMAAVIIIETSVPAIVSDKLAAGGVARTLDAAVILIAALLLRSSASLPGIIPPAFRTGFMRGALWACGFGIAASLAGALFYAAGLDPFEMIRVDMPATPARAIAFFAVAGVISPLAEELVFRGAVFGVLRRYGALSAIAGSSLVFSAAHHATGLQVTHAVGGLVFALSYEIERNLVVPLVIHVSGNLALLALGLL